jgi:hypothetical protein
MRPLDRSSSPMTVLGWQRESFTAEPSRRNSGLLRTPKSTAAFFPENSSKVGITILYFVPGKMVLRMTTVCRALLLLSASPICSQIRRIYRRSRLPLAWLGVPTQTKDSSVSWIGWTGSLVARKRPALLESGWPSWSLSYGSSVPIIEYTDVRKPKSVSLLSRIHQLTPQCVVDRVR